MKRRAGFTDVAFPPASRVAKVVMALDLDQLSVLTQQIIRPPFSKVPNLCNLFKDPNKLFAVFPIQISGQHWRHNLGSC